MDKVLNLLSPEDLDPATGLTNHEKQLVENSWNLVKTDIKNHGVELFILYFTDFPEYQNFFPFRGIPLEELRKSEKLRSHGVTVMYTIGAIIDNLRDPEVLMILLHKNALSHSPRGVKAKHYWDLKKAVMKLLRGGLGSEFTKETEAAWDKTLNVAFTVIVKAL
ncbi:hypothetical protein RN001_014277 [Aquatica leii]|uniref:Globin domain-containing protein n=1 Tax=Aquatica leii TaxID=1421715 RepID=A0AAN7P262_9COLE|nr:hypothetical protein RN001_014277 [Aquatica leii]